METSTSIITSKYLIFYKSIDKKKQHILKEQLTSTEYKVNDIQIELLKECIEAKEFDYLVRKYGLALIKDYLDKRLLFKEELLWTQTRLQSIEIEINSDCNFRCQYCPVSLMPRSNKVMPLTLFNEIINKAKRIPTMKYISLSSFNEPLLDPHFQERIEIISETNLKLQLSTNGSHLNDKIIRILLKFKILDYVKINLPSINESEYIRLTGTDSKVYHNVINNIESAIDAGLNVKFSVNGTKQEISKNIDRIKEKYEHRINEKIVPVRTMDRAGILQNKYFQNVNVKGRLSGWCFRPLIWVLVSITGDLYLCSNDYSQKYIYGNIKEGELEDILNNEKAKSIRKQIYGETVSSDNFICRKCEYMARGMVFDRYNPLNL